MSCVIESECAHCQRPMRIEMDSELKVRIVDQGAEPIVHVPMVDVAQIDGPSIIDGF